MSPFDDSIPEERGKQSEDLIALLRQAYRQEQKLPENEQKAALARVEERLARSEESELFLAEKATGFFVRGPQNRPVPGRWMRRTLSTLAALLVVSALIGGAIWLFAPRMHSQAGTAGTPAANGPQLAGPVGTPVAVNVQWDGLTMSMRVTPGPYFLGELLAVDLSLTNQTHSMLTLAGWGKARACSPSPLYPEQTGGTDPRYALYSKPMPFIISCPAIMAGDGPALIPGQTTTTHTYALLTSSGNVTLTGMASFYMTKTSLQGSPGPLTGHLPVIHMHVASQPPTDRVLTLQQSATKATIQAPTGIQLVNRTYILCQDSPHDRWPGGYDDWEVLSTSTLQRPDCAENSSSIWINGQRTTPQWKVVLWKYAIGAAGYAVAQGQWGSEG